MKLTVRYFASIREALGPNETMEVAAGSAVGTVRDALIARGGAHATALARGRGGGGGGGGGRGGDARCTAR
jgi:sulfur-carrier protein